MKLLRVLLAAAIDVGETMEFGHALPCVWLGELWKSVRDRWRRGA